MYLKKAIIIIFAGFISVLAAAQANKTATRETTKLSNKPTALPVVYIKGDNSLLFEITGPGLVQSSWLFGTMHVLCEQDAKLSTGLKSAIKQSENIYFEIDMDNMEQMMGALKFIRMNHGIKLSELLTPIEYDRVKTYFDKNKPIMPFAMMNRFKPYFVTALIGEDILDCDKKISMEQLLLSEAKKYEKTVEGLETLEFQASIFDSIPYEKQAKDLVNYVDSIEIYRSLMQEAVTMYKKQNISKLDSMMQKSDPGLTDYMDLLLYQRNRNWVGQIRDKITENSCLFAFGAGHLGGAKGVINLLRQQGFIVRAIKN